MREDTPTIEIEDCLFGVKWDLKTTTVLNAILMDILAFRRLMQIGQRLVIVCQEKSFLKRACKEIGVALTDDAADVRKCEIWKLYYIKEQPECPAGDVTVYTKQVDSAEVHHIRMTQGDPRYPSLFNPGDNHMLPPGKNPNINKVPPRYYRGYPNALF